ncbi:MAG TPA: hypothetical protein VLW46_00230 [Candidatus Bathyarchaeia archaeon]|nr:hypothetical protein [Candidatus Bathyarchaeia archaeon]
MTPFNISPTRPPWTDNPTGHDQLALAYGKTGRKQDAEREMALFQQTSEKMAKESHGAQPPQQP